MAFGTQFHCTYLSSADIEYTLNIYVKDFGGSSTEINLGAGGCVISYDTDGENKFASVISSKMQIPFLVETSAMATFITNLRTTYQEQEVYAHLYAGATEAIWSGYIIMDLGAEEDVSEPYEVVLTATDGIGLLKDRDFVQDGSTIPYAKCETYLGYSTTSSYKTIVDWLAIILAKTGMATTDEGAATNYRIQTCVDWYNEEHAAVTLAYDPLDLTKCKMDSFYTVNDNEEYSPDSFYDVLESLCKAWGMRCIYWHHNFYFIQISLYKTNESGTAGTPVNLPTREYYHTGGLRLTQNYVGSKYYARYELSFENTSAGDGTGLQKLAGTKYNYYPIIKQVSADYVSALDVNYFNGFPLLSHPYTSTTGAVPANTVVVETRSLGIFSEPADVTGWYCRIPLDFYSSDAYTGYSVSLNWTIKAVPVAGGTTYMLSNQTGALTWVSYISPTGTGNIGGVVNGSVNYLYGGHNDRTIFDSTIYNDAIIPTSANFTGDWEFFFEIRSITGPSTGAGYTNTAQGHGAVGPPAGAPNIMAAIPSGHTYNNDLYYNPIFHPIQSYKGIFTPVVGTLIGSASSTTNLITGTTDSFIINIGSTYWGDNAIIDSPSSMQVYDGANWVFTAFSGEWGVGTLAGTASFTELLCEETLYNQSQISMRLNGTSALSETNKKTSGTYIKYVNPIGRIEDLDNRFYAMLRGQFVTGIDEWNGEWFEVSYNSLAYTGTTQDNPGENTGEIAGGGNSGGPPVPMPGAMFNQSYIPTTTTSIIAVGSITSIPIIDIGSTLLATNDVIEIYDFIQGASYQFVLSADQESGDASLSVVSQDITTSITKGSIITISSNNLIVQYQRKTEGTIGNMPVAAERLGPIEYKGGTYFVTGVDPIYVKILPRDFVINEDGGNEALEFKDATSSSGLTVGATSQEMLATVNIPYGTTATHVTAWGSSAARTVEVYECGVDTNGIGSAIGTGTLNGSPISITSTAATETNYLLILVKVTLTSQRIYGGQVTLTQNAIT